MSLKLHKGGCVGLELEMQWDVGVIGWKWPKPSYGELEPLYSAPESEVLLVSGPSTFGWGRVNSGSPTSCSHCDSASPELGFIPPAADLVNLNFINVSDGGSQTYNLSPHISDSL